MKYWTAFAYENKDPVIVHCTHKYLGELSSSENEMVSSIIDQFMSSHKPMSFTVRFDQEAYYGVFKTVRVLRPSDMELAKLRFLIFGSLRAELDHFREDDFIFNPHISTPTWSLVDHPFTQYVYCRDDTILKTWNLL